MATRTSFRRLAALGFIASCSTLAHADKLVIKGIPPGQSVVVMMDARIAPGPGGCVNDRTFRSNGVTTLPNYLKADGCNSEIAIFSSYHRMTIVPLDWTAGDDVRTITLSEKPIVVPVQVWIVDAAAEKSAREEIALANSLYSLSRAGLVFDAKVDVVADKPAAVSAIGAGDCDETVKQVQDSAFYEKKTLNVYYVKGSFTGRNCAHNRKDNEPLDANIIFIGELARASTLAHEFAHALGLRRGIDGAHVDFLEGFTESNIMWVMTEGRREHFTLGQVFRMHMQKDKWGGTILRQNGLRIGDQPRSCRMVMQKEEPLCPKQETPWPAK